MPRSLVKLLAASSVTAVLIVIGCGKTDRDAYHQQLAQYSPENLASEMANRFLAGQAAAKAKANPANAGADIDAESKGEAVTKEALTKGGGPAGGDPRVPTAESVALDIARKAESIEGMTKEQVFEEVETRLRADRRLNAEQVDTLTGELRRAMGL